MSLKELKKLVNQKVDKDFTHDIEFIFNTIKNLGIDNNSKILDIGTGYGIMASILALNGFDVLTGEPEIDPFRDESYKHNDEHQEQDHEINHHAHHHSTTYDWKQLSRDLLIKDKIKFCYLDAQHLDFPNETFDAIFMYDALHHIDNKKAALGESIRILKIYGILCVIETNQEGIEYFKKKYNFTFALVDPRIIIKDYTASWKFNQGKYSNSYILIKTS